MELHRNFKRMTAILAVTLAGGAATAYAVDPTYHGAALFELSGPVKEFNLQTQNQLTFFPSQMQFAENGQVEMFPLEYNEKGYPTGCDFEMNGKTVMKMDVKYNAEEQISEMYVQLSTFADMKMRVYYTYEAGKLVSARMCPDMESLGLPDDTCVEFYYTDVVYDDHGNWTSRTVTVGENPDDPSADVPFQTYTETRTITYY